MKTMNAMPQNPTIRLNKIFVPELLFANSFLFIFFPIIRKDK